MQFIGLCKILSTLKGVMHDPLDMNAQVLQLLPDDALRHAPDQILQ